VAAVIVIAASIVVAAVHTRGFGLLPQRQSSDNSMQQTPVTATDVTSDVTESQEVIPTLTDNEAHLYDDISLEQIIDDMTAKYDIQEVVWRSEEAKSLRLYYRWEPSYSIDKVVDMLNSFQAFTIQRTGNKLIISDIANSQ
jgi:arginine/lysine/ornithine decarboxylase